MAFWNRSRPTAPPPAGEDAGPTGMLCTDSFRQILSAARALADHHGLTRDDDLFDANLGFGLAQRYVDERQPAMMMGMTTAILLSHCGWEAPLAFVRHLRAEGRDFDVDFTPDGRIEAGPRAAALVGMMDVYALARDRAVIGDVKLESGPFSGPARLLWDLGYHGIRTDHPQVKEAQAALARRALNAWGVEPSPA